MSRDDVEECLDIIEESQSSITVDDGRRSRQDNISCIFEIVKKSLNYKDTRTEEIAELENKIIARGYKVEDLRTTLKSYERAGVLMQVGKSAIKLVDNE